MTRCLTAAALLLCASVAFAQADRENRNRAQGQGITAEDLAKAMTPPADYKQFATRAAEGNLFEIRMAELAEQKSQSQEVKQLGAAHSTQCSPHMSKDIFAMSSTGS